MAIVVWSGARIKLSWRWGKDGGGRGWWRICHRLFVLTQFNPIFFRKCFFIWHMPLEFPGTLVFCFMVSTSFVLSRAVQRVSHTDILKWVIYHLQTASVLGQQQEGQLGKPPTQVAGHSKESISSLFPREEGSGLSLPKGEKPLLLGDRVASILGSLTFCSVNSSLSGRIS